MLVVCKARYAMQVYSISGNKKFPYLRYCNTSIALNLSYLHNLSFAIEAHGRMIVDALHDLLFIQNKVV